MSDYKTDIRKAAKHLYGDGHKKLKYNQFTDIITRLYGTENENGSVLMYPDEMNSILEIILGKPDCNLCFDLKTASRGLLEWIYDLEKNDGYVIEI